jgi:hypothetical protein
VEKKKTSSQLCNLSGTKNIHYILIKIMVLHVTPGGFVDGTNISQT